MTATIAPARSVPTRPVPARSVLDHASLDRTSRDRQVRDRRVVELMARGVDVEDIATRLVMSVVEVEAALDRAGVTSQAHARQLAAEYQQHDDDDHDEPVGDNPVGGDPPRDAPVRNDSLRDDPVVVDGPPVGTTAQPSGPPSGPPGPVQRAAPGPNPAAELLADPRRFAELLARGAASDHPRTRAVVDQIRARLDDLRLWLDAEAQERVLAGEITQIESQLAVKRAALRALRAGGNPTALPIAVPVTAQPVVAGAVPDARTVRAWARRAGVACNPHGRVPAAVLDAYRAAHPDAGPDAAPDAAHAGGAG